MGFNWTFFILATLYLFIPGYSTSPTQQLMPPEDFDMAEMLQDGQFGQQTFEDKKTKRDLSLIDHATDITSNVGQMVKKGLKSTGIIIAHIGGGVINALSAILASDEGSFDNSTMANNATAENSGVPQDGLSSEVTESKKTKRDLSLIDHATDITSNVGQMFKKGLKSTGIIIAHIGGGVINALSAILASDEGSFDNSTMANNASTENVEIPDSINL